MFFSKDLLSKNDPLCVLWIAGTMKGSHVSRRLSKGRVLDSNIVFLKERIVEPQRKLALRTAATLLLGIVVIYQRKMQYLVAEGNVILNKFRNFDVRMDVNERVDLPVGKMARYESITLPKVDPLQPNLLLGDETHMGNDIMERWDMIVADAGLRATDQRQTIPAFDSFEPICITVSDGLNMYPQRYQDDFTARKDEITLQEVGDGIKMARNRQDPMFDGAIDLGDGGFQFDFDMGQDDLMMCQGFGDVEMAPAGVSFSQGDVFLAPELHSRASTRSRAQRRKRKYGDLILDEETELENAEIRNLINDPTSILRCINSTDSSVETAAELDLMSLFTTPSLFVLPEHSPLAALWKEHCSKPKRRRTSEGEVNDLDSAMFGDNGRDPFFNDEPEFSRAFGDSTPLLPNLATSQSFLDAALQNDGSLLRTPESRNRPRSPSAPVSPLFSDRYEVRDVLNFGNQLSFYKGMEERSWKMVNFLQNAIHEEEEEGKETHFFSSLLKTKRKDLAAKSFYQVLVLTTNGYLDVEQLEPFGKLSIRLMDKAVNDVEGAHH